MFPSSTVTKGSLEPVKSADLSIDLNDKTVDGDTALHIACLDGKKEIVNLLIDNSKHSNIELTAKNNKGKSGLQMAFDLNGEEPEMIDLFMETLVNSKIDLNIKDNYGYTPFHNACQNGHVKLAEMLMKKSIELDIDLNGKIFDPAYDGWTPFHLACFFGKTDIVKIMIDNSESLKLDLTAKDKNKQTGFQLAQRNKQQRVVLLLHWNNIK